MNSFGSHLLLFLAVGLQLYDVSSWSFTPVSQIVGVTKSPGNTGTVHFMCHADVPLVKCQYNYNYRLAARSMFLDDLDVDKPIDLSQGSNSGVITRKNAFYKNATLFHVSYNGTGLEHGQCGATFTNVNRYVDYFGCRGADEAGEWQEMHFVTGDNPNLSHGHNTSINHRQVVAFPGSEVSILLKTNATMRMCRIKLVTKSSDFMFNKNGDANRSSPAKYRYFGSSPSEGECGLTFLNIKEDDNGPILLFGWTDEASLVARLSTLIVTSPPPETYFNVDKMKYSVGDKLKATCSSLLSRPVANLTWTLDDRIIRQDMKDDEFQKDVWSWPWDKKNITQRMSITLEEEHFGKKLECSVHHLALYNQQSGFNYLITKSNVIRNRYLFPFTRLLLPL